MNLSKCAALALVALCAASFTSDADAQRRLGGGLNMGRQAPQLQQRQALPPKPAQPGPQQAAPAQQPNAAGAPAAAARPASPLRGMLMGAAAGLGLAALAHWLGFGESMAMVLLVLLVGAAAMMLFGLLARRSAAAQGGHGGQPAYQMPGGACRVPASAPAPARWTPPPAPAASAAARPGSAMDEFFGGAPAAGAAAGLPSWGVPAGFDTEGFLARTREHYAQLQAAWDSGDLAQLQEFTSNEMFIALTHELRKRSGRTHTEILALDARLLGIETVDRDYLASVRFTGELKIDGETEAVDEVWNLVKPVDGRHGWLLAGIQQIA